MTNNLYRHFNAVGQLLYVGVSLNAINRLAQHKGVSHWFEDIARVEIERHDNREAVLEAERKAIYVEKPLHNLTRTTPKEFEKLSHAENSKKNLLQRISTFEPIYKVSDAARVLGMSDKKVKILIAEDKIGWISYGQKTDQWGTREIYRITGWQLIEFIEALQAHKVKFSW